jgi:2-dehydro-3-deoxy-D-arabinonate dehydratase
MMQLCRFYVPNSGLRLGALVEGTVYDLSASGVPQLSEMSALLQASLQAPLAKWLAQADLASLPATPYAQLDRGPSGADGPNDGPHLLPPIDRQEVWAAGVTYVRSREARMEESATADVYARVYEAERPEIFFKSTADRCVGPYGWIGVRGDSAWNVPEPELALVLNPEMQIVGYSVGNDVSSRDIEGENPLYLPQAKVYRHSCALGPVVTLADQAVDATDLDIALQILRGGEVVFQGATNTSQIHRRLEQLAEYLGRYYDFPHGAVLLTGTCIVPGDDFTLTDGDEVVIEIEQIGILRNPVKQMV